MNLRCALDQIDIQEQNRLLELSNPTAPLDDLDIQVLQLPLRLKEGVGTQRDLLHQVKLHHVQVMRQLLLQPQVL
ncbi:hypothetical protein ACFX10_033583 [Malus domestica]